MIEKTRSRSALVRPHGRPVRDRSSI